MKLEQRAIRLAEEYQGVSKIALSYSGGLDSAVIGVLLEKAGFEVFPIVADLGQKSDLPRIVRNAKSLLGSCRLVDAEGMMAEAAFRALKSNYGSDGRMATGGLSRPVLARVLAEAARSLGCDAIAHGSSGTGNDHIIMENSLRTLAPEMRIIAPVRDLDLRRDEAIEFAKKLKLPTNLLRANRFSVDENLWCRAIKQGMAVDLSRHLPEEAYQWSVSPQKAPAKAAQVKIEFANGVPTSVLVNGRRVTGAQKIIDALNEVGGAHGMGRLEAMDDKLAGLKVREAYECPAAQILLFAHREIESLTLTTRELDAKHETDSLWAKRVHEGFWNSRLRHALDAFTDEISRPVDGTVSLEIYKGGIRATGRQSPHALYDTRLSSRDSKAVFSQKEGRQFAKLYGLQEVIAYMLDR
ncbi:MAG: argininosuccinate synthase [Candidatus Micrarchaeota archaeon]|nr:argininosuccinate synthase [Candidatus Micrarchaeota archaeon]